MSPQEIIFRFYELVVQGDIAGAEALVHPDFIGEEAASLPYAGTYKGLEGWRRLLANVGSVFTEFMPTVEYALTDETGTRVIVMVGLTGRSIKTGERFETSMLELWELRDGLISLVRPYYWDTHLLRRVSGMEG
jgi:ketosteroid isomerase-like protein